MTPEIVMKRSLEKIDRNLKKVDKDIARKVMRPAMSKALAVVQKTAKQHAPWKSIKKLIGRRASVSRKNDVYGKIFIKENWDRTIKIDGREVPFHVVANILEFGRAAAGNKGGSKIVKPVSFMRSAPSWSRARAINAYKLELTKRLKTI